MTYFRVFILVLFFAGILPRSLYAFEQGPPPGWIRATTNSETPYYKEANLSSGLLGYFTRGAEVTILPSKENDYFQVYFTVPVNGSRYAWIPAAAINIDPAPAPVDRPNKEILSWEETYPYYFIFGGALSRISPANIQSKMDESPYAFLNLDYLGEFGFKFISIIDLNFQVRSNSFEHSVQGYESSVNYYIHGISTMLGIQLHVIRMGPYAFLLGGGAGYSFNSAGNNARYFKMNTDGLMGYPAYCQARFQYLYGRIGVNFDFGYLYHTVINVPVLRLPIGDTQSTANIDTSSFYGTLGVSLHF